LAALEFTTGKPWHGSQPGPPDRRREYAWLAVLTLVAAIPYGLLCRANPPLAVCLIAALAGFSVIATFATSARLGIAHHIRFLLAGRNPIGMTGASSMWLGGVDALLDWNEDQPARRAHPARFWAVTAIRFLMTPVGLLLLIAECLWDLALLRRSLRLVRYKCEELLSVAWYHDQVCPEKSNDIFYADLAWARYQLDPNLYQWNRMRALVFELQHYRLEWDQGLGNRQTNLLRQDELTAYQTLKRLRVEEIEDALDAHYGAHPAQFPIPASLAVSLIRAARPLAHYLRLRQHQLQLRGRGPMAAPHDRDLHLLLRGLRPKVRPDPDGSTAERPPRYLTWHLLRLLDADAPVITTGLSRYVDAEVLLALQQAGVLEPCGPTGVAPGYRWSAIFIERFRGYLQRHFQPLPPRAVWQPDPRAPQAWLRFQGTDYVARVDADRSPGIPAPARADTCLDRNG
jgi:hypothetical protein